MHQQEAGRRPRHPYGRGTVPGRQEAVDQRLHRYDVDLRDHLQERVPPVRLRILPRDEYRPAQERRDGSGHEPCQRPARVGKNEEPGRRAMDQQPHRQPERDLQERLLPQQRLRFPGNQPIPVPGHPGLVLF